MEGGISLWNLERIITRSRHGGGVIVPAHSIKAHVGVVDHVSSGGRGLLVSCGRDGTVKFWKLHAGGGGANTEGGGTGHVGGAKCAAVSRDGLHTVSGGCDRKVAIWERWGGGGGDWRVCCSLGGHRAAVGAVAVSSDGKTVASGSRDR